MVQKGLAQVCSTTPHHCPHLFPCGLSIYHTPRYARRSFTAVRPCHTQVQCMSCNSDGNVLQQEGHTRLWACQSGCLRCLVGFQCKEYWEDVGCSTVPHTSFCFEDSLIAAPWPTPSSTSLSCLLKIRVPGLETPCLCCWSNLSIKTKYSPPP